MTEGSESKIIEIVYATYEEVWNNSGQRGAAPLGSPVPLGQYLLKGQEINKICRGSMK